MGCSDHCSQVFVCPTEVETQADASPPPMETLAWCGMSPEWPVGDLRPTRDAAGGFSVSTGNPRVPGRNASGYIAARVQPTVAPGSGS